MIDYLHNFNARKDATLTYVGRVRRCPQGMKLQTIKIEICDMAKDYMVIRTILVKDGNVQRARNLARIELGYPPVREY